MEAVRRPASADFIVLKPGEMLVGQDQPPVIQTASVIDAIVVNRGEHIYIDF